MTTDASPTLRPLRIGEILDVAIKIVWRNARTLIAAVLVVAVPLQLIGVLITLSTAPEQSRVTFNDLRGGGSTVTADQGADPTFWTGQVIVIALAMLMATLATAACFKAIGDAYLGGRPSWKDSLGFVLRRLHSVLWLTILTYLLLIPAFVALVIPGMWLWISWSVAVPALLLEGCRGRKALGRSFRLVKGSWWPTFAAILVGFLLASVVGGIIQGLIVAPIFATDANDTVSIVANGFAQVVGALITTPFQAAVAAVIYFDLRVRKEAFDLQLLADRLGLPTADLGASPAPSTAPERPGDGAEQPPYWPPPPGWRTRSAAED